MAECATLPSNFKLQCRRNCLNEISRKPQKSFVKFVPRNCKVAPISLQKTCKHKTPFTSAKRKASPRRKSSFSCCCFGSLIESESAAAADWVPVIDQVLLMASVFLTYMAGVIPTWKSAIHSQRSIVNDGFLPKNCIIPGRTQNGDWIGCNCLWDTVKEKLRNSLQAIELGDNVENWGINVGQDHARQALSLYAVSDGPRFRLLWSSLEQLEKEVNKIADSSKIFKRAEWLTTFCTIMERVFEPACISWIEEEFGLKNCKPDKAVFSSMSAKLNGDAILWNIRRLGKVDLYADLLYFLRYGPFRECCHYDCSLYILHGVAILEDLVITLADGIASIYLELISVDSDISDKMPNLGFTLCSLSTRALQKLRNEVAMKQWLNENVEAVVSMYEDRFDLCTLQSQLVKEPIKDCTKTTSWWRKFSLGRSATVHLQHHYAVVTPFVLPVKRTKELRALTGWKYYFSLLLELSDILMPLVTAVVAQVRNAISFFLVSLIGRSLGLIYTGIRQCLRWK
ncbi:hypothetical protein Ancab_019804 [Ancistrocladus abbreviatus]